MYRVTKVEKVYLKFDENNNLTKINISALNVFKCGFIVGLLL